MKRGILLGVERFREFSQVDGSAFVMTALVSIIIPCYNAADWVAATLESALSQDWPNCEVILVDDGSRDASLEIARTFESRGVKVLPQKNSGASTARNTGLRASQGDFVQFLDADDLLARDKISRQMARLMDLAPGTVAAGPWGRFHGDPANATFEEQPTWRDMPGIEFMILHYNMGWMMPPLVWLTPRSVIEAAGPWREDITLNDDGEYFCRVLLRSKGIGFCGEARSFYRSGLVGSLSGRNDVMSLESLIRSIEATTAAMLAAEDSARTRAAAANAWQVLAYDIFPKLPHQAEAAARKAKALGGASRRIEGGSGVRLASQLFGWRIASQMKRLRRGFTANR